MPVTLLAAFLTLAAIFLNGSALAQSTASATPGSPPSPFIEEVVHAPRRGTPAGLVIHVCRPRVEGPAPLAVINHGRDGGSSDEDARDKRAKLKTWSCGGRLSSHFWARGYVLAFPVRRGYGETGGADHERGGGCDHPDHFGTAKAAADDIEAAIAHLKTLPYVAREGTIVLGVSVGGLATVALAARQLPGISAYINFSGGLRYAKYATPQVHCAPHKLVEAFGTFGRTSRSPTLWLYANNDTFFGPDLVRQMHQAFLKSGGIAELKMLHDFKTGTTHEGHHLFGSGDWTWTPIVFRWLATLGKK